MCATLLLADANSISRVSWEALLRDRGYLVVAFASGESLVASCPRVQPDLVLFIASAPDKNGEEFCHLLKTDPRNKGISAVIISGSAEPSGISVEADSRRGGVWQCSNSREEVLSRVQSILRTESYTDKEAVSVLTVLAQCIEARNPYTKGHMERVHILAAQFGNRLQMSGGDLETLKIAASIHDIGKVMLPDSILLKKGWLTLEERSIMEQHPIEGERICSQVKSLRDLLPIIRHHHERIDGSGYPDGLHRDLIPFGARVLQIVNTYDGLTAGCVYRMPVPARRALIMLTEQAESRFLDRKLVETFVSLIIAAPRRAESHIAQEYRSAILQMN